MDNLKRHHSKIHRIQVSQSQGRAMVLTTGIDPSKVFMIPIGINRGYFPRQTPESKRAMREKYDVPQSATVIGSFQKDGEGWGEGNEAKLIKGPDVFLKALEILKTKVKNLFVLLSGPSRGYIKQGLDRLKIPYRHQYLDDYPRIGELFQCLDLYIISSREEGGPKAVLESMSAGIPLVTTRVGQAVDLVRHEKNGWMVDTEDFEGLAFWAEKALTDGEGLQKILEEGQRTAEAESYVAQTERWGCFFQGFVDK
jgi:glycosyltransferase involved in cell wall biosynthesis